MDICPEAEHALPLASQVPRHSRRDLQRGGPDIQDPGRALALRLPHDLVRGGASHSVTVTARNANGTTNTGYRGTIRFTSSDTKAILPPNYTFTSGDSGVHTFSLGVKLKTAGTQWVRATDTGSATNTGAKTGIVVKPGGATHLTVTLTSSYAAGAAHTVKITVKDSYGNVATGYRGTIHFTSSDSKAVLPANHTFTSGDAGVHSFSLGVKLKTVGTQWVRATDTNKATITGVKTGIHVT